MTLANSCEFNAMEVRKEIMENLNKQSEVEKVLSVYVNGRGSNPAVFDIDNKLLIEADIKFISKVGKKFEETKTFEKVLEKSKLRLTKPFRGGRITREEFLRFRNETGWRSYY